MSDPAPPLLVAEAANPEWVSVPLVGWSLAEALRRRTGGHIVTQVRNREAILRAGLVEGQDFTTIDTEFIAARAYRLIQAVGLDKGKGWTFLTAVQSLTYPVFEKMVWERFAPRLKAGEFSLVHRITPLTPTAVGPLGKRCRRAGIPFVLGPLNGGVPWPPGFDRERRREKEWLSYIRGIYKLSPGRSAMLEGASAILAGSRHTAGEFGAARQSKVIYIPENGIVPARFQPAAELPLAQPLRAVFVGRLVPYKGPDMALQAAAPALRAGALHLEIVGDGPMASALRQEAENLGVSEAVTFHGQVPHTEVQEILRRCALLLFPSVREFGGGVVLEAMAMGVVPLIVDYAGPGELIDPDVGIKVPIGSREEIVASLTRALDATLASPEQLKALSENAKARIARHYTWDAKAAQITQVYDWVRSSQGPAPSFDFSS